VSRFLVDAQLPPVLAQWLRANGHEAEHVAEIGLLDANDNAIWQRALQTGAAIITKDEDFSNRSVLAAAAPTIVWVRLGNCRNTALIAAVDRAMPGIAQAIAAKERVIELM
jgi:predicted nuclease of predicted toxin-antitoxin system